MHQANMVALKGRLTAEPVLKQMPNGDPVLTFGIAVNRSIARGDGKFEDLLDGFFNVEVFGLLADALSAKLAKGTEVQVCGTLHQNKFTPKGSDREVSRIFVRAKTVAPTVQLPKRDRQAAPAEEPVGASA